MAFDINSAKPVGKSGGFDLSTAKPVGKSGGFDIGSVPKQEEPGFLMPGSKSEAGVRGFANAATFGLAPRISAGVNSLFNGESFGKTLKDYLAADKAAQIAQPGASLAGAAVPTLIQAAATGGGSLARQAGVNAAMGATNAVGNSDKSGVALAKDALTGGAIGGALGAGPGLVAKGATAGANAFAKNAAISNIENLIATKPPGWKQTLEKIVGDTSKNLKKENTSLIQEAKHAVTAFKEPGRISQYSDVAKDAVKSTSAPLSQLAGDAAKTVGKGALGAAATSGINYALGSNVDPTTAAVGGALLGAHNVAGKMLGNVAKNTANKIALSNVPEVLAKAGTSAIGGAVNQLGTQAATKDIAQTFDQPTSPFGKLTSYLTQAAGSSNPEVQQAAEQAQVIADSNDPDAKRKASMVLQSTPQGRAVGNSTSSFRDLEPE